MLCLVDFSGIQADIGIGFINLNLCPAQDFRNFFLNALASTTATAATASGQLGCFLFRPDHGFTQRPWPLTEGVCCVFRVQQVNVHLAADLLHVDAVRVRYNIHLRANADHLSIAVSKVHVHRRQGQRLQFCTCLQVFLCLFKQLGWILGVSPGLRSPDFAVLINGILVKDVFNPVIDILDVHGVRIASIRLDFRIAKRNQTGEHIACIHLVLQIKHIHAELDRLCAFFFKTGKPVNIMDIAFRSGAQIAAVYAHQPFIDHVGRVPEFSGFHTKRTVIRHVFIRSCDDVHSELLFFVHLLVVVCNQQFEEVLCIACECLFLIQAVKQEGKVTFTVHILLVEEIPFIFQHTATEKQCVIMMHCDDGLHLPDAVIQCMTRRHHEGQGTGTVHIKVKLGGKDDVLVIIQHGRKEKFAVNMNRIHYSLLPSPKRSRLYGSTSAVIVRDAVFLSGSSSPTVTRPV